MRSFRRNSAQSRYLFSVDHPWPTTLLPCRFGLPVVGAKGKILANGFRAFARCGVGEQARWVGSFALINRTLIRALITSVVLAAAGGLLAACDTDQISLATNAKANQPVPPKLVEAMAEKDMDLQSP